MSITKRIIKIFIFLTCLLGILLLISGIFIPKNNLRSCGMEEQEANGILAEMTDSIDVLVVGDSESFTSVIPKQIWNETGYTTYVCGTCSQTLDYSDVLMKRCFKKQRPKIVILETHAIFTKLSLGDAVLNKISEYIPLLRYHDRWKKLKETDFTELQNYNWIDKNKGYRLNKTIKPSKDTDHMIKTEEIAEIPEISRIYVRKMKRFCDKNGVKFVLMSTPSTKNWTYKRHNAMEVFSKELGCEYIDMNLMKKEIPIDWKKDTRDKGDHLNHYGAKKVSTYLAGYLVDTGLLKNKKHDPEYSDWK